MSTPRSDREAGRAEEAHSMMPPRVVPFRSMRHDPWSKTESTVYVVPCRKSNQWIQLGQWLDREEPGGNVLRIRLGRGDRMVSELSLPWDQLMTALSLVVANTMLKRMEDWSDRLG